MNDILEIINEKMTGGGRPVAGKSLGECAAIDCKGKGPYGHDVWEAYLYLWDDNFSDWAAIAGWFLEAGAEDVTVSWVMYDHENGDRDGRTDPDGARAVVVTWVAPKEA